MFFQGVRIEIPEWNEINTENNVFQTTYHRYVSKKNKNRSSNNMKNSKYSHRNVSLNDKAKKKYDSKYLHPKIINHNATEIDRADRGSGGKFAVNVWLINPRSPRPFTFLTINFPGMIIAKYTVIAIEYINCTIDTALTILKFLNADDLTLPSSTASNGNTNVFPPASGSYPSDISVTHDEYFFSSNRGSYPNFKQKYTGAKSNIKNPINNPIRENNIFRCKRLLSTNVISNNVPNIDINGANAPIAATNVNIRGVTSGSLTTCPLRTTFGLPESRNSKLTSYKKFDAYIM
ncbi:hypothetical protein AX774_g6977 [Zancudomyces culisetae]|uniref:Uncharacterized protein n=1 Tax=Zancudomyces culisetae TaxID=1213189 RepID=A0A1R1PF24_ZANCU|nr:hypothetical protein AX774_g6977 [Zancudomyces culisetae]|eukprot:OMH79605.1 hypothetical protein AX774_g6977 [Zancudomyces culisetae]